MHGNSLADGTGPISQLMLGICAGLLLAMAAAMLRARRPAARWTGFAFFLTSAFFAVKLWSDSTHAFSPDIRSVIGVIAITSVGWFWLMVLTLFSDRETFRPVMLAGPALAMGLCGIGNQLDLGQYAPIIWIITTLLQSTFAILALVTVVRSWKDDLVERRRRVRGPFMGAVALYILSLNGFDVWDMLGDVPAWYPMLNAAMLMGCTLAGAFVFLDPSGAMFGDAENPGHLPASPIPTATRQPGATPLRVNGNGAVHGNGHSEPIPVSMLERAAKADIDRLECLMIRDQVWKEEGLTIASLALRASMPEAHLRRLINDRLGYRNFPSYVNAHRIAAAKTRLADPNEARVSISTIAYDIGFASLGPFNRAFKDEAGLSPSEWRRKALGEPSPISESA